MKKLHLKEITSLAFLCRAAIGSVDRIYKNLKPSRIESLLKEEDFSEVLRIFFFLKGINGRSFLDKLSLTMASCILLSNLNLEKIDSILYCLALSPYETPEEITSLILKDRSLFVKIFEVARVINSKSYSEFIHECVDVTPENLLEEYTLENLYLTIYNTSKTLEVKELI